MSKFMEFVKFNCLVTPSVIVGFYCIATLGVIGWALFLLFSPVALQIALSTLLLGPLAIRLICEMLMVLFKQLQVLKDIAHKLNSA